MILTTRTDRKHRESTAYRGHARDDRYVHLVARVHVDPPTTPGRATERLRDAIAELQPPLARLSGCSSVISTRLFRAARLTDLGSDPASTAQPEPLEHYDLAMFVRLTSSTRVDELLDTDAFRQVLDVLHARGRDIMITPARNVGAIEDEPGRNRLSLIHHVAHEVGPGETWQPDTDGYTRALALAERELLLPSDPVSAPFQMISRAELDEVRTRELVVALVRGTPNADLERSGARAWMVIPHLYWELPVRDSTRLQLKETSPKTSTASEEAHHERPRGNPHNPAA
jgi:hypothetical protein